MNSVVFLDIDGVLNSSRSVCVKIGPTLVTSELVRELARLDAQDYDGVLEDGLAYGVKFALMTVDPVCVALLNKLIDDDTHLVLSSSHRTHLRHAKMPYGSEEHLCRLRLYLTAMGVSVPKKFSITPQKHGIRGAEIEHWMNQAYENGRIDDDDPYVILDDSSDMLPGQPLVYVNPEHGLSFSDFLAASQLLRREHSPILL